MGRQADHRIWFEIPIVLAQRMLGTHRFLDRMWHSRETAAGQSAFVYKNCPRDAGQACLDVARHC
eukprot:9124015-Alexandrium_andersonii.AAC.1